MAATLRALEAQLRQKDRARRGRVWGSSWKGVTSDTNEADLISTKGSGGRLPRMRERASPDLRSGRFLSWAGTHGI